MLSEWNTFKTKHFPFFPLFPIKIGSVSNNLPGDLSLFFCCWNIASFVEKYAQFKYARSLKRPIAFGWSGTIKAFLALVATVNHVICAPLIRLLKSSSMGLIQDNSDSELMKPSWVVFCNQKLFDICEFVYIEHVKSRFLSPCFFVTQLCLSWSTPGFSNRFHKGLRGCSISPVQSNVCVDDETQLDGMFLLLLF